MLKPLEPPTADPTQLTTREKVILLNASKLNGCKFWPWETDPSAADFEGEEFVDGTAFHLSIEQLQLFTEWKRCSELGKAEGTEDEQDSVDLVQDVATDCSVVASLCALTARAEALGPESRIITSISFPKQGRPVNGKHIYKLNFNGCYRKVEIDDRLPASNSSRAIHVFDRKNPRTVWPALVEKAYLKVRGGYDFPGSNSGTDLWVLTGWIPEQLFLRSEDLIPNAVWKRIFTAFDYGDVLITIGTGKLNAREEKALGLASEHAYAIIGMKEEGSRRLFHIKNPWSQGGIWKGYKDQSISTGEEKHAKEAITPGTFWMDLNNVFQNFLTIYLNWNPGLFGHRYDVHFTWDMTKGSPPESFSNNPQYILTSRKGGSVWLLLNKHFQTFRHDTVGPNGVDPRLQTGFLSLYAFESQHRIVLASGALLRAPYVDAPNILLRFEMPANTSYVIVPSEQDIPAIKHDFTLSAFSTSPLAEFKVAQQRYPHMTLQDGAWTLNTSGGNANSPHFSRNPQFRLDVPHTTDVAIVLETKDPELAVQIKVIWAHGKRIPQTIVKRDIYSDSGEYRRGTTVVEIAQLLEGTYTVACSTFQPGQLGPFTLKVSSALASCTLKPIPTNEPGMFSTVLPRAIFPYGIDRILAPLYVSRLTRLHVRAKSLKSRGVVTPSPLKISIEFGQGSNKVTLSSTEEFVEALRGTVQIPERDLKPHMCAEGSPGLWLVLERMDGGAEKEEDVYVEVFSSEKGIQVGAWGQASDEPIEEFQKRLKLQG